MHNSLYINENHSNHDLLVVSNRDKTIRVNAIFQPYVKLKIDKKSVTLIKEDAIQLIAFLMDEFNLAPESLNK